MKQKNPQARDISPIIEVATFWFVCVSYSNRKQKYRVCSLGLRWGEVRGAGGVLLRAYFQNFLVSAPKDAIYPHFLALRGEQVLSLCEMPLDQLSAHCASESLRGSFILFTACSGQVSLEIKAGQQALKNSRS